MRNMVLKAASIKTVIFSEVTQLSTRLNYEEWCLLGCYAVWLL
jgi:hypothetical protein